MQPFKRILVDYAVVGTARISWEMSTHFVDPGPYTFQLQVGHTALEAATDWVNVGSPVVDTYMTTDTEKRLFGKTLDVHYRVQLTTSTSSYTSMTQPVDGLLLKRDWLKYREIARKEQLRHSVQTSPQGYLLKAIRYGPRCPACTDQYTEETTWTNCPTCYGTGFLNGYFPALPAYYADVSVAQAREHRDPNVGMQKQETITARFIGDPQLYSYDVWCNATSDERYYLHTISVKAQVRSVVLIYDAELRIAPFTDPIYNFNLNPMMSTKRKEIWQKPAKKSLNYLEAALLELKERRNR